MYKKLIINVTKHETRVALLEDGTIAELFIKREDDSDIAGNIHKGRVQRVLPGMQAAFVDIGLNQAAFIYVDDIICENHEEFERLFTETDEDEVSEEMEEAERVAPVKKRDCHIEDLITDGQEIMVQVAKSPIGTKGARVTSYISLPGRFLVLMPISDHIGISRRIEDEKERTRLRELIASLRKGNMGYIIRTAAE
ncbi:MAG: ribonuclease E/G, partial [Desulfobacteraceae bacterium 4572_88]